MSYLSQNIHYLRRKADITQMSLAQQLGVSQVTVNRYETAVRVPHQARISQLAQIFGVTVEALRKKDLAQSRSNPARLAKKLTAPSEPEKVIKNLFLFPQSPEGPPLHISVALDGTADSLTQAIAQVTALLTSLHAALASPAGPGG